MRKLVLSVGLALAAAPAAAVSCDPGQAVFATPAGPLTFTVEIADTPAERALGLMHRKALEPRHGMLFVYDRPQEVSFWMKDTLIPLDLIFMDASGRVRHVHPSAKPLDLTPIPGAAPGDPRPERQFILEIAGGEAARQGLTAGAVMASPFVAQSIAALPCR
ncbi:MAG: DUF192 domain-containing protein [Paracoccus sp. (in: a-proteobacteria)]|uniref:DUF192 domain-containing protein n=1 Tax=Paracoccus sp. TaxID=267 RepID=UPI0026DFB555|nr:DUF192 domain-containing protein [Paracoccus sp. (in: a-proteobacteria)]MDO5620579.1 DUF192 domain-containing protein [Paracoccus sp. (in: a-proteobacteria)]